MPRWKARGGVGWSYIVAEVEELECRWTAVSSEERLIAGFRLGDGGRVELDVV